MGKFNPLSEVREMKRLLELIVTFMKIGLFTFGGGYAMIAVIDDICVERKKWITQEDMMKITIIAESTPGPVAINCATFVGYQQAGVLGAIFATLGVVLPSFVIIYIISMFLDHFLEIAIVAKAFKGIKIAVGLLIFQVGMNMRKKMKSGAAAQVIMIGAFGLMLCNDILAWEISSVTLIVISAVVGVAVFSKKILAEEGEK